MRSYVSMVLGLLLTSVVTTNCVFADVAKGTVATDAPLQSVRDAARRVRTSTLDVINDVEQRKGAAITGDPRFLFANENKDRDLKAWAQQTQDLGPLEAPRKSWLDADVAHVDKWVGVLQTSVTDLIQSNGKKKGLEAASAQLSKVMQDVQSHLKQLHNLSAGPKYDNLAIGKAALVIHEDVAKLEQPWKQSLKK